MRSTSEESEKYSKEVINRILSCLVCNTLLLHAVHLFATLGGVKREKKHVSQFGFKISYLHISASSNTVTRNTFY